MLIETDRLVLKEISSTDMEMIHQLHSVPEIDEFNTLGIPKNLEETIHVMEPFIDDLTKTKAHETIDDHFIYGLFHFSICIGNRQKKLQHPKSSGFGYYHRWKIQRTGMASCQMGRSFYPASAD